MTHYVAMSGLRGCIPNTCDVHRSRRVAVAHLAEALDLETGGLDNRADYGGRFHGERQGSLARDGYRDLSLYAYGAEYADVIACQCATPWIHSDDLTEEAWKAGR
jgi:hypothetical protein